MTLTELADMMYGILPEATFGEDNDGQLIIYTNLLLQDNNLVPFPEEA